MTPEPHFPTGTDDLTLDPPPGCPAHGIGPGGLHRLHEAPDLRALYRHLREEYGPDKPSGDITKGEDGIPLLWAGTSSVYFTALYRPEQLKMYIKGSLHAGITRDEIAEVFLHSSIYAGFPAAAAAFKAAKEVFAETEKA